jgi:hypothetical protein
MTEMISCACGCGGMIEAVSHYGRPRKWMLGHSKKKSLAERFWAKVNKDGPTQPHMDTPCWVWIGAKHKQGYGLIDETDRYGKKIGAHRASWIVNVGPIPEGMDVLHKCDNPPCVNSHHLFLGNDQDNMDDKYRKGRGRHPKGEEMPQHILTKTQVDEIRAVFPSKTRKQLATEYGVSYATICDVISRRSWC